MIGRIRVFFILHCKRLICISLEDIHDMAFDKIEAQLMSVKDFNKIIVNAVDYADLKVFCVALYRAMAKGKVFMFRTAAAIVKVMGGVTDQPLLTRAQMVVKETDNGGIIVVGSHTNKTTAQVEELKKLTEIEFVELDATLVRDEEAFEKEVQRCLAKEEECIRAGKTVCCYTTRALITADTGDKEDELRLSVRISDAVQSLVGRLTVTPAFVIAKGGITSSDVGTKMYLDRSVRASLYGRPARRANSLRHLMSFSPVMSAKTRRCAKQSRSLQPGDQQQWLTKTDKHPAIKTRAGTYTGDTTIKSV